MSDPFRFDDGLGPEKVVHIWQPALELRAVVVVDNTACGPAIGGVRMAPDATAEECFRLARAMTFKNAAAGLPHGGGKSVILADPAMPDERRESLIRAFAQAIRGLAEYIPGPDMGTDERAMAWVREETGRAVGLPEEIGGIPLDQIGATGFGVAIATEVAARHVGFGLADARVAIQGFGAVGRHAAKHLAERGARIVAVADSRGTAVLPEGFDVARLVALKEEGRSVGDHPGARVLDRDAVATVDCDIFVPAARPDILHEGNADAVRARLVVPGANIPATEAALRRLHERGILVVPDFVANAGGVITAAFEWRGGTRDQAFAWIESRIRENVAAVLERSAAEHRPPHEVAVAIARERVERAMRLRRFRA
jgi:glutamate dehydrogenase/leucine dehydrogenase